MGAAIATNTANDFISATTDIVTTAYQNCQETTADIQEIAVIGCSNVTIDNNYFNQFYALKANCVQTNQESATVQNQISQQVSQLAQAITQQFGLSAADANEITNNSIQLQNDIQNTFVQNCSTQIASGQQIKCVDSNNVEINGNTFTQTIEDVKNCTQNNVANNNASNSIKQVISQTAKAKEANFLSGILGGIAAILILGIILMMIFSGGQGKGGK